MSPELYINGQLIADVPDRTGHYTTLSGKPLYVNVDGIHSGKGVQTIILESEELKGRPGTKHEDGRREIQLSRMGTGSQLLQSSGDSRLPDHKILDVLLEKRPIRGMSHKKYLPKQIGLAPRELYLQSHPRWQKGHGRR